MHSFVAARCVCVCVRALQVLVSDVMSTALVTVRLEQTKGDVRRLGGLDGHHGFPVMADNGRLHGLLNLEELEHFDDDTPISEIVDQAPCCIHTHWPVERAHRLFATLGLRHIIVMERDYGRPVGIVTRHDLQHMHWRPRQSRFSSNVSATRSATTGDHGGDASSWRHHCEGSG